VPARPGACAVLVAAVALSGLTAYGLSRHTMAVAGLVVGTVAVFVIPARMLPALGLALFSLLPVLVYLPPASLVLIVWLARRNAEAPHHHGARLRSRRPSVSISEACICLFALWCLVATLFSVDKRSSIEWTLALVVSVAVFALTASRDRRALDHLRDTWIVLAAVLGAYALVEAELLHRNPLFAGTYAGSSASAFTQYTTWTTYRATTTLGHPLLNSTFFAAAVGFSMGSYVKTGSRRIALAGGLASAGVLVTASRSGLIALGAAVLGAGVVALLDPTTRRRAFQSLVVIGVVAAAAGTTLAATTLSRSSSREGASSISARTSLFQEGLALARQRPVTGFGPGALLTASRQFTSDQTPGNYEDSYLETAISAGVIGLVLLLAVVLSLLARTFAARDAAAFGALASYLVSAGAFNLLQGYMPALFLLGALAAISLGSMPPTRLARFSA
jgi:O-antigen ligase